MKISTTVSGLLILITLSAVATASVCDIADFGAEGGGKTLCTSAIQAAIDKCAADGGGTVRIGPGKWLTGTVYLRNNVTIDIQAGAVLLGSRNRDDYAGAFKTNPDAEPIRMMAMIAGRNVGNVAVTGRGTIDGSGEAFRDKNKSRPKCIKLENCSDVLVHGVRMRNAGSWMQHYIDCDRLVIRDIVVFNHATYNNDGLNIDHCRDVTISGCNIDADDDAIVLKSLSTKPCEHITISDCVVSSHCNAVKMGTESGGGFRNITVTNCTVCSPRYSKVVNGRQRGLAGVALEIVDGGTMDRIAVSNITVEGVTTPIFIRLGNRARIYGDNAAKPDVGILQNVVIDNIIATNCSSVGCSITGLPDHPVRNVSLSNISLSFEGGAPLAAASRKIDERPTAYPESTMFGQLPAYGFYCRHVQALRFHNIRLDTDTDDLRHAIVCDDVSDLTIDALRAESSTGAAPTIRLSDTQDAMITRCTAARATTTFLQLSGNKTSDIVLIANDLSDAKTPVQTDSDVPPEALKSQANIKP